MGNEHHLNYMSYREVEQSAKLGNRVAHKIARDIANRAKFNAAIRHAIATRGIIAATAFACELLGMNHADACRHVSELMKSEPDDIVSPHYT